VGYDLRKPGSEKRETLLAEEQDVKTAMAQAGYDSYDTDPTVDPDDFTPTAVLYRVYRRHVAQYVDPLDDVEVLSRRKFGAVMGVIFPHLEERDIHPTRGLVRVNRVQRTYHGRRVWGYLGVRGPESIRARHHRGRPPHEEQHDCDDYETP
jgi:hypothetical protein